MSIANKALAVLAALAFFLPFVTISCNNQPLAHINGHRLVQCAVSKCSPDDMVTFDLQLPGMEKANRSNNSDIGLNVTTGKSSEELNLVLYAAIAVVVAIVALFVGRAGGILSGIASVAAIVLLLMFRSKFLGEIGSQFGPPGNTPPEMRAAAEMMKIQMQLGMGFWGSVILSGVSAILAFLGVTRGGAPAPAGASGFAGGYAPPPQRGPIPPSQEQLAVCPSCGSVNSAGSKFCLSCGAAMAASAVQPAQKKAAAQPQQQSAGCPSCGSSSPGTGKFCLACGKPLAAPAAQAPETKAAAEPQQQSPVCPSCGSSSPGTGKFCLACGKPLAAPAAQPVEKKAVEPQPQSPVCPSCGSSSPGTGKFCLSCGSALAAPTAQPVEKKAIEPPQSPVCPSCGSSSAGTGKFCLSCGAALAAAAAQPVEKKAVAEPQGTICGVCGASNPATSKFCLSCGGSLMANVQLFQPSETSAAPASPAAPVAAAAAAAAQASASAPAGQPLYATAPATVPEPPVEPVAAPAAQVVPDVAPPTPPPTPPPVAEQPSLDWTASPPSPEPTQQACAACGTALNEGQKFCLACGTPVGQPSAPAHTEAPAFTPAPQPEHIQPPAATQIFQPAKKSSATVWIVVVLLLAVVGTGGYFAWKYFMTPDVNVTARVRSIHVASGSSNNKIDVSVSGSTDIDWSVQEGDKGGKVTGLGAVMDAGQPFFRANYSAPQTSGIYHVVATCHANPKRSTQIEVTVLGSILPEAPAVTTDQPAPPSAPTATTSTTSAPAAAYPNAAQIVGTWSGPTADMRTTIGADSTLSETSAANPQKNLSGTYHFTDNTHLDVDFGNGDVRKWEILGIQGAYLRISEQSKTGSSATIFQKIQ